MFDDPHGLRTAWLAARVARHMGLDEPAIEAISDAARLHDIGKRDVDPRILNKPGPLDPEEREQIEKHVLYGALVLLAAPAADRMAAQVALLHHEWWNGMGYPLGLAGEAIPLSARITAVADVFDALSEERCYKPAWSHLRVMGYIAERSGTQFDPRCVAAMLAVGATLRPGWQRAHLTPVE